MDKNFELIIKKAADLADSQDWQDEIRRLPSGKKGFVFMSVEDALDDLAVFMHFDGETFTYDGPPIPDYMVEPFTGGFMAAELDPLLPEVD